ncbi:MAG: tRNA (adenosine(37)-N6)-dimethylallyltransferase MiaA [Chlamydiales bacterium]|nr:tRNA (adenosine(37)-N6)-dimethylallyltransferase MiaA [Chlamydiales bacterium]
MNCESTTTRCPTRSKLRRVYENVAISVQEKLIAKSEFASKKVIILAGPTGSGKTSLSLELAEKLGAEIVSSDSMQVYKGMDIGTAKATKEEQERVPHHLIDIRDILEPLNVKDYYEEAMAACRDILMRGRTPIIVGGTGFYIHSLLYGPPAGPGCDPEVRATLQQEEERYGIDLLFDKLSKFDPEYTATISRNDRHKILRALEIIEISGRKVSSFEWKSRKQQSFFDFRPWFLHWPREILYQRLEKRCDDMLSYGLLEEVVALDRAGIRKNHTACQAIGYRQTLDFLDTAQTPADYQEYVRQLKIASRHLAKRQFTWFRKEPAFRWLNLAEHSQAEAIEIILQDFERNTTLEKP